MTQDIWPVKQLLCKERGITDEEEKQYRKQPKRHIPKHIREALLIDYEEKLEEPPKNDAYITGHDIGIMLGKATSDELENNIQEKHEKDILKRKIFDDVKMLRKLNDMLEGDNETNT